MKWGHFVAYLGTIKYIGSLLEGDKSGLLTLVNSFPRPFHFRLLFYLENIYSKKVVFLIASGGKKWSLHYNHTGNGGKKWGPYYSWWGLNVGRGDYPLSNTTPDILSKSNFLT
jgi:hypothetical protein